MTDLTPLTNEQLDDAITACGSQMTQNFDALLKERERRAKEQLAANLEAERFYMETGVWPDEIADNPTEIIRIRKLSCLQVERMDDESKFVEDLCDDHYESGKTYIETTRRMVEALYSRICGYCAEDIASYGADTTEAESDMVRRSALVSREALSARLAKECGFLKEAREHASAARRYKKASHYNLMKAV